jgi:hypothetical protein
MAENKKSFIAYADWKETFDSLPDEVAGKLIKHIFAYVNDENPSTDDYVINGIFANIKNTLKRDLKKWEKQYEQRVNAGRRSAEVRKQNATTVNDRSTTVDENQISSTVSDSVSDSVTVNDSVNEEPNNKLLLSQVDESTLNDREKEYYQIASSFWTLIKSNLTELNLSVDTIENADYKIWTNPIRLLMETDKRTLDEIREVFTFVRDDEFWKQQIQSTSKLRKKDKEGTKYFDILLIKSRNEKRKSNSSESNSGVTDAYKQSIYNRLHGIESNEEVPEN